MPRYASNTTVPVDRSRSEIEKTLQRYGATGFMYGWDAGRAVIGFRIEERMVRIDLPLPDPNDSQFMMTETGRRRRDKSVIQREYEQACRQRWRALALIVKAKLEAIESGISTVENEFMANLVLPDGRTVGEWAGPQLKESYDSNQMPPMLPGVTITEHES